MTDFNQAAVKREEELNAQLVSEDLSRELGVLDEKICAMETIVTYNLNLVSRVVHNLFKRKGQQSLSRSNVFNV
jgi:CO dehydrogenase/acetyl-CoA synthase delta subunit